MSTPFSRLVPLRDPSLPTWRNVTKDQTPLSKSGDGI